MEKAFYIVFIIFAVGLICLSFFLVARKNDRLSQGMIAKNKASKQTPIEVKQQAEKEVEIEETKKLEDENLEAFVLEMEEEHQVEQDTEEDFDYESFVDQNIDDIQQYADFENMGQFEDVAEPVKQPPNDFLKSILFGNKISDED